MALINGTNGNDSIQGGTAADTIFGLGGHDRLRGGAGADAISGGDGVDSLDGELGDDILHGGADGDFLQDFEGTNLLLGEDGDDMLYTGGVESEIDGGNGDDTIVAWLGDFNYIYGGAGSDRIELTYDALYGAQVVMDFEAGAGGDVISVAAVLQASRGYVGNPFGTGFLRLVQGGPDMALQWDADGAANGASYETILYFYDLAGTTLTAANFEGLALGSLVGWVEGADGADTLTGSALGDEVYGLGGADRLGGGVGNDTLTGGTGADRFMIGLDGSVDTLADFLPSEGDTISLLSTAGNAVSGAAGRLTWLQNGGQLFWDADGDGAQAMARIGTMSGGAGLARASLAEGFQPGSIRILLSNGVQTDLVFDWTSTNSVDTIKTIYTSTGGVEVYEVTYDDGASALRYNDLAGVADWSSRVVDTDGQGRMTAYSVTHDDGSRSLFIFDVANRMFYSRLIEEYDALGRMSQQAAASDDGSAYERHFDTYDTQPWAYYHDSYRADGLLISHTYYNADGTVYAG